MAPLICSTQRLTSLQSKHIVNVFKEAKAAYRERKAEIHATRLADNEDEPARHALKRLDLDDREETGSKASRMRRTKSVKQPRRPPVERGYTDSFYANDPPQGYPAGDRPTEPPTYVTATTQAPARVKRSHTSPLQDHHDVDMALAYGEDVRGQELIRRHSDSTQLTTSRRAGRSHSVDDIDMDLAYGELPPPLPPRRYDEGAELRGKVTKLQQMLDEANCLQHSVTTTIESLQKNPEALAAVGLALAEISTLARKMAPGALVAMRGAFPAIFALLASPQFLIATGVGVGVVVVMLGGYKIIKRIRDNKELEAEGAVMDEGQLRELEPELSHIERWRRGIAEAEAESVGTSVDGEFITPMASRIRLDEGTLKPEDLKSSKSGRKRSEARRTSSRKARSSKSVKEEEQKKKKKTGEHSGLRAIFTGHST